MRAPAPRQLASPAHHPIAVTNALLHEGHLEPHYGNNKGDDEGLDHIQPGENDVPRLPKCPRCEDEELPVPRCGPLGPHHDRDGRSRLRLLHAAESGILVGEAWALWVLDNVLHTFLLLLAPPLPPPTPEPASPPGPVWGRDNVS